MHDQADDNTLWWAQSNTLSCENPDGLKRGLLSSKLFLRTHTFLRKHSASVLESATQPFCEMNARWRGRRLDGFVGGSRFRCGPAGCRQDLSCLAGHPTTCSGQFIHSSPKLFSERVMWSQFTMVTFLFEFLRRLLLIKLSAILSTIYTPSPVQSLLFGVSNTLPMLEDLEVLPTIVASRTLEFWNDPSNFLMFLFRTAQTWSTTSCSLLCVTLTQMTRWPSSTLEPLVYACEFLTIEELIFYLVFSQIKQSIS